MIDWTTVFAAIGAVCGVFNVAMMIVERLKRARESMLGKRIKGGFRHKGISLG